MKQEDKELLSKDLCARLPYGVKIETEYFTKATLVDIRKNISYGACKDLLVTYDISGEETPYQSEERSSTISKIKPYLFPLSSMTEEQKEELKHEISKQTDILIERMKNNDCGIDCGKYHFHSLLELEWCLKNHFDIYGLIPKGLANDATGLNIY